MKKINVYMKTEFITSQLIKYNQERLISGKAARVKGYTLRILHSEMEGHHATTRGWSVRRGGLEKSLAHAAKCNGWMAERSAVKNFVLAEKIYEGETSWPYRSTKELLIDDLLRKRSFY